MNNNIVVCTDHNYSRYVSILFESIILNTNINIHFFVIYSTINESDKHNIEKIVTQRNENKISFVKFNFQEELEKIGYTTELPSFRGGYDAYTRLFLPQLLKKYNADYCLYLDVDTIVNKNLDNIFELLNNTKCISGILDTITIEGNHSLSHEKYINSGVLLMNLKTLDKIDFTIKSLDFANNRVSELKLPDQDIINNVFPKNSDYITLINSCYNMYYSKTSMVKEGVVLHFTGPYKPWMPNCRWRLKKCIWAKYSLATKLLLKNWNITKSKVEFIGFIINCSRILLNLWVQIRIFLRIIKK